MRVIEFETYLKPGKSIEIPDNFSSAFKENEHIKVIVLKEDALDAEWSKMGVTALFNEDDATDDIYESLRKK